MKRVFVTLLLAAALLALLPAALGEEAVYDFSHSTGVSVEREGETATLTLNNAYAYAPVAGEEIAFNFRWEDASFDWMGIAVDNSGYSGLSEGRGLKAVLWKAAGNAVARVTDTGSGMGWEQAAAAKTIIEGSVGADANALRFDDGEWHSFLMRREETGWIIEVDGFDLVRNRYDGFDGDMDAWCMGSAYLCIYTSNNMGSVQIGPYAPVERAQAGEQAQAVPYDFSASENVRVSEEEGVHTLTLEDGYAYTVAGGDRIRFRFRWTDDFFDWMGISVDNSGPCPLGEGQGLKVVLWKSVGNALARMVGNGAGKGWDEVASTQTIIDGAIGETSNQINFADGEWHTFELYSRDGTWQVEVDGIDIVRNRYDGFDEDMNALAAGEETYLTIYTGNWYGEIQLEQIVPAATGIANVDASIDPTLSRALPEGYEQAMTDGMPLGVFPVGDEIGMSGYGVAVAPDGTLYYADYDGTLVRRRPDASGYVTLLSEAEVIETGLSGLYTLSVNGAGELLFARDSESGEGMVGVYDFDGQSYETLLSGLTRPRQICVDSRDNVYVACENGNVWKWERETGESCVYVSFSSSNAQGVCVLDDGTMYVLCYSLHSDADSIGVSYTGGRLYQVTASGDVTAVAGGDTQYIWRARAIVRDEKGYLYLTGEANAWDNGNSALLARFDPALETLTPVLTGLDYATFCAFSAADGRFYMPLTRDACLVAYSPRAAAESREQEWTDVRVATWGGDFVQAGEGEGNLTIQIAELTLSGTAAADADTGRVCGWIRVPAEALTSLDQTMIPHPSQSGMPGMYRLPEVGAECAQGRVATAVIPLREHVSARWPLRDLFTANENFSEAPEAYLVYFEWAADEAGMAGERFRDQTLAAAGAPVIHTIDASRYDFGASAATVTQEGNAYDITFNHCYAYTLADGGDISLRFRWPDDPAFEWMGISVDNSMASGIDVGRGVRVILWRDSGLVSCRTLNTDAGLGWNEVENSKAIMEKEALKEPAATFNDGEWHTFRMKANDDGSWTLQVDGADILRNVHDTAFAELSQWAAGERAYMTLFTSDFEGRVQIEQLDTAP